MTVMVGWYLKMALHKVFSQRDPIYNLDRADLGSGPIFFVLSVIVTNINFHLEYRLRFLVQATFENDKKR